MSDLSVYGQAALVVALLGFVAVLLRIALGSGWSEAARLPLHDDGRRAEGEAA